MPENHNNGKNSELDSQNSKDTEHDEKPVLLKAEAYKTIILYASRYANKSIPKEDWKEIYGVLIGHSDEDFVHIERAEALTFGHATDVKLDVRHYGFIEEIQNKLDEENKGRYIVGWFHSHPGLGLFFSYIDLLNQLGFQGKNPDAIGLVFDHTLLGQRKEEKIEGTEHTIMKYETGFEIYRLTDPNLDVDDPAYDTNYHKVDCIVKGLNKFFFANVLSELSALVSAGKPLQSAYQEEDFRIESNPSVLGKEKNNDKRNLYSKTTDQFRDNSDFLQEIPKDDEVNFNSQNLFYEDYYNSQNKMDEDLRKKAEELIFRGNRAFKKGDAFSGVEKYREGIKKYQELGNNYRVLELLKNVTEQCLTNNHLILAGEFAESLFNFAEDLSNLFYLGEANYLLGYIQIKQGNRDKLMDALSKIRDAAVIFEKEQDFVGASTCFQRIGSIYQNRLKMIDNAVLFYTAAIENYNKAILKGHPQRKSTWSKPEVLKQKIVDLRDMVEELIPLIENNEVKKKILNDLRAITYNF
jgi:proteasome lid subunit RPN8/RPN11